MNGNVINKVILDGQPLTAEQVVAVARNFVPVEMNKQALENIITARKVIEKALIRNEAVYGLNTGFGSLAQKRIDSKQLHELQENLVRSHAVGVGEPLSEDIVRAIMLILAASLCRGHSGVRPILVTTILEILNQKVYPHVPSRGSVGASGDLAPLAHVALVLMGEGEVLVDNKVVSANNELNRLGIAPVLLQAKEGLALLNGTHLMTALFTLAWVDFGKLFEAAIIAAATTLDACKATDTSFDTRIHEVRTQTGQQVVARMMRDQLAGSEIVKSHKEDDPRVQDPYSLRCIPQVLGAVWDMYKYVEGVLEKELAAVTDNPLVFPTDSEGNGDIISGGNFHGLPLALAMDSLTIAVSHLAGIAERRIYFLLAATDTENPINTYLSPQPGLHSGYMITQYTAAACCNEIQTLTTPASVANIPTSAGQEDYNSFGPNSGLRLTKAIQLATYVVAIELLCAVEALEYHLPLRSGDKVENTKAIIRDVVPRLTCDRSPAPDIKIIAELINTGKLRQ